VENQAQFDVLRFQCYEDVQGCLLSRALPAAEITQLLPPASTAVAGPTLSFSPLS
jgi:EAL domain-containing protein (putative c-di-GMP-specific phosphodiesterase class I)